jgi:hypothetical protein
MVKVEHNWHVTRKTLRALIHWSFAGDLQIGHGVPKNTLIGLSGSQDEDSAHDASGIMDFDDGRSPEDPEPTDPNPAMLSYSVC